MLNKRRFNSGRICFVPGSESDVQAMKKLPITVAHESSIYADAKDAEL